MTDFYPNPDRFLWPFEIDSTNDKLRVIEDPGGSNDTVTIEITQSSQLTNDTAAYYACGLKTNVDGSLNGEQKVIDGSDETLFVKPLYEEIVSKLRANSTNNLDYLITAIQPSGSDYDNTGLRLTTAGSVSIKLDFSPSDTIDPRFLGWDKNGESAGGDPTTAGADQDGPFARWGQWYSPSPNEANDKRRRRKRRSFQSAPHPRFHKAWEWTLSPLMRDFRYSAVAGAHVFKEDRAGRTEEQERAGIAAGDSNNALEYLWERIGSDPKNIIVGHGHGTSEMGRPIGSILDEFEAIVMQSSFRDSFAPQKQTGRDHAGERYDLEFTGAANDPDDTTDSDNSYRH